MLAAASLPMQLNAVAQTISGYHVCNENAMTCFRQSHP
jgi:hypothetical protein